MSIQLKGKDLTVDLLEKWLRQFDGNLPVRIVAGPSSEEIQTKEFIEDEFFISGLFNMKGKQLVITVDTDQELLIT